MTPNNDLCTPCYGIGANYFGDQCLCGENAILDDGVCVCADEHIEWETFGQCRPKCLGDMNEFDQSTGTCICSHPNSYFSTDDSNCVCDAGYMLISADQGKTYFPR